MFANFHQTYFLKKHMTFIYNDSTDDATYTFSHIYIDEYQSKFIVVGNFVIYQVKIFVFLFLKKSNDLFQSLYVSTMNCFNHVQRLTMDENVQQDFRSIPSKECIELLSYTHYYFHIPKEGNIIKILLCDLRKW